MFEDDEEDDSSYSALDIKRLLQCPICLDRFKQPKLLPCQHTFCQDPCLEGLVRGFARSLKCPECRAEHRVPYNGVGGFPNNLTIKSFLELRKQRTRNDSGDRAGGAGAASADCRQNDQAVPSTAAASRSECGNCNRETFLAKCGHCEQVLCEPCTKSHIEQVKTDVLRLTSQIRRGIPHITNAVTAAETKSQQLQERAEVAKADVTEIIERFIMELRGRQRLLHSEIEMFVLGEVRSMTVHKENLEVEMASLASFCDTAESALSQPDADISSDEIVQLKTQCAQNMATIKNYETGTFNLPRERNLKFLVEENSLSHAISNFGEITTVTPESITNTQNISPENSHESTPEDNVHTERTESQSSSSSGHPSPLVNNHNRFQRSLSSSYPTPSSPRQGRSWDLDFGYPRRSLPSSDDIAGASYRSSGVTPRRSLQERRRQHYSDTRIAALVAGRVLLAEASPPTNRRHTDISRSIPEEPYHSDPGVTLPRSRTYTPGEIYDDDDDNDDSGEVVDTLHRARPSVRFNVATDEDEETASSDDEEALLQVMDNDNARVANAMNNYQNKNLPIVSFGQRGNDDMQFTWPRGVAVTREDHVLVADSSNHRVQVFDNTGRFIRSFGSYGQNEGEFDCLAGISVNSFGQIVIVDRYNHRIQVFDHHGVFRLMFGEEGCDHGQLLYPWGVASDRMGFIYVCDKENHRIQVFQSSGRFVRAFGSHGHGPGQFENPHYLAISPDSKVYVSDSSNHRIQVFSIYGDYLFSFGSPGSMQGQMRYPKGILIDEQGFVVVCDSGNNRIQVFYGDGRYHCMFGAYGSENGQFKGLEGIAILSNGNLVVSDRENHRIQIF